MKKKIILFTLAILLLVSLSFGGGIYVSQRIIAAHPYLSIPQGVPPSLETVWQVWQLLSTEYVDKQALDAEKMRQEAIKGMLKALNDPYTSYLNAENARLELSDLQGKYEGIGAHVGMRDNQLTVIAPIPDSPAAKAGIRPGDVILEVDGVSIAGLSLQEAVIKIRGPQGTPVRLLVRHEAETAPESITIVREPIEVKSVRWQPKGDIAHIQLSHFSGNSSRELARALEEISAQGLKGIALDLRANPGGLLTEVVEVASQFLKEGETVLFTVNNRGERQEMKARGGGRATGLPLVVMVDGHSASGSEVLAGALQDMGRAMVMGAKTFGKGSVNVLYPLKDGSGLYLTTARWLTPKGRPIEGEGLAPDVEVVTTAQDRAQGKDPVLDRALAHLGSRLTVGRP